jgi:Cd2+/Zn2+-exporting ATPase
VIAGILLAILPPSLWGWDWETTIYRALIFLVVASPCALMAAIMPTLLSGIALPIGVVGHEGSTVLVTLSG